MDAKDRQERLTFLRLKLRYQQDIKRSTPHVNKCIQRTLDEIAKLENDEIKHATTQKNTPQ